MAISKKIAPTAKEAVQRKAAPQGTVFSTHVDKRKAIRERAEKALSTDGNYKYVWKHGNVDAYELEDEGLQMVTRGMVDKSLTGEGSSDPVKHRSDILCRKDADRYMREDKLPGEELSRDLFSRTLAAKENLDSGDFDNKSRKRSPRRAEDIRS